MFKGNYLNDHEVKSLVSKAFTNEDFLKVLNHLKQYVEFDEKDYAYENPLKFDVAYRDEVITAQAVTLLFNDEVKVSFIERYVNGQKDKLEHKTLGLMTLDSETEVEMTSFNTDSYGTIIKSTDRLEKEKLVSMQQLAEEEELELDPSYIPGELNDSLESQAWYSGCIPGGYIWCGEGCVGNNQSIWLNATDNCCRHHDNCYTTYGVRWKNCRCDQRLCDCVKGHTTKASVVIRVAMCFSC